MKTGRICILIGVMPRKRKFVRGLGGVVVCAGLGAFAYGHFTKQSFPILDCERLFQPMTAEQGQSAGFIGFQHWMSQMLKN